MTHAARKRAIRRAIDRHGRDVTHRYYTSSTSGGRETWSEPTDSPDTITARVERAQRPVPKRDVMETGGADAAVTIYVKDSVSNLRDGGGEGASEIDVDGQTYVVLQTDDQDNGLIALRCERA